MATNQYLAISDGTTTITIADGVGGTGNYKLLRGTWSPQVAGLRRSQLGGAGPYDDVTEEMELIVSGTTAAAALENINSLSALIDQAEQWYNGGAVSPVLIKYSPRGGTVSGTANPLQAVILGRADNDDSTIALPDTFEDVGLFRYVANMRLRFKRRGMWLHTAGSATSGDINNGEMATVDLTTASTYKSPCKVEITSTIFTSAQPRAYILLSDQSSGIRLFNAETMGTTNWTAVNGTANYARNGSVLTYTPAGTAESYSAAGSISALANGQYAIFANIRNNSGSASYNIKVYFGNTDAQPIYTPPLNISTSGTLPLWYFLGMIGTESLYVDQFKLGINASGTGGSISIDTLAILNTTNDTGRAIAVTWNANTSLAIPAIIIDHNALDGRYPTLLSDTGVDIFGHNGDIYFSSNGRYIYCAFLKTGYQTNTFWRNVTAGSVDVNSFIITRTTGYLSPV